MSLGFVSLANLDTDEDTNTITLNFMDHFLFSTENWIPELSYCTLHAACFFAASLITGKNNTAEQVASSLGPDSAFIQWMASPLAEDDESAAEIANLISVDVSDLWSGYALLYERRDQLSALVGQYATDFANLPSPEYSSGDQNELDVVEEAEEDLDVYEEVA